MRHKHSNAVGDVAGESGAGMDKPTFDLASVWDSPHSGGTKSRRTFSCLGVDGYNQSITGAVAMTVTCAASDCHHVPLVITIKKKRPFREQKKYKGYRKV